MQLFDMLANAQNGNALDQMARQYGLSQKQMQDAVDALMPAFSQGLKRNVANPYDLGSFLTALSSGQHAKYFEDASKAFSPQGVQEGNGILGHLFGSKDLSRAVAAQASQATGIGQDVLRQMLPALATMIMGGLFKQSSGQAHAAGFAGDGNPLQQIIEQMMKQGGGLGAPQPQQRQHTDANPLGDNPLGKILEGMLGGGQSSGRQAPQNPMGDNPLGKILEGMLGGGQAGNQTGGRQAPQNPMGDNPLGKMLEGMFGGGQGGGQTGDRQAPQNPMGDNPFGKIFEEMMRGGSGQPRQQSEPAPRPRQQPKAEPPTNPSGRERTSYDDLFGDMFETGRKNRDDYEKNMGSIFDQFLQGMKRPQR